jgi:Rho-binding antiterminator
MTSEETHFYHPIDCDLYDELVLMAMKQQQCHIRYRDTLGQVTELEDNIVDIFSQAGQERLKLGQGLEIRLDYLIKVNGIEIKSYPI